MNNLAGGMEVKQANEMTCPECGAKLIHESGCPWCSFCGWSQCG